MSLHDLIATWIASRLLAFDGADVKSIVFAYQAAQQQPAPMVDRELVLTAVQRLHAITSAILATETKP